jgi:hypothetical protein
MRSKPYREKDKNSGYVYPDCVIYVLNQQHFKKMKKSNEVKILTKEAFLGKVSVTGQIEGVTDALKEIVSPEEAYQMGKSLKSGRILMVAGTIGWIFAAWKLVPFAMDHTLPLTGWFIPQVVLTLVSFVAFFFGESKAKTVTSNRRWGLKTRSLAKKWGPIRKKLLSVSYPKWAGGSTNFFKDWLGYVQRSQPVGSNYENWTGLGREIIQIRNSRIKDAIETFKLYAEKSRELDNIENLELLTSDLEWILNLFEIGYGIGDKGGWDIRLDHDTNVIPLKSVLQIKTGY